MVELKTHAAQLGWNTCNPSLLSGFAFCWQTLTVFHIICMAGTHTPMNQHIHTSHVTPIHTISTIRHYSFPLVVHPCKLLCCVLHGFAHKLCLFNLFFYVYVCVCTIERFKKTTCITFPCSIKFPGPRSLTGFWDTAGNIFLTGF